MIGNKECYTCKVEKPIADFHKQASSKDGLTYRCKPCVKEHNRVHYLENKEAIDKRNAAWRSANSQKSRDCVNKSYSKNKEYYNKKNSLWKSNNKDKVFEMGSRRRATKAQASPLWIDDFDKSYIKDLYKNCRTMEAVFKNIGVDTCYHIDHITPLKGKTACGLHYPENFQILTSYENLSKGSRVVEQKQDPFMYDIIGQLHRGR